MSDDMSNPARRAARMRMRENAQHLAETDRDFRNMTVSQRIERAAALQAERAAGPSSGMDRLNAYHGGPAGRLLTGSEPAELKERNRLKQQASEFQYSAEKELYLTWEAKGDPKFDALDPQSRMALGFYRRAKAAAKELGLPTGAPRDE